MLDATIRDVIPGLMALCLSVPKATGHAMSARLASGATPAPSYRTALGSEVAQLLSAYESVASIGGVAGQTARNGILKAIQSAARKATGTN